MRLILCSAKMGQWPATLDGRRSVSSRVPVGDPFGCAVVGMAAPLTDSWSFVACMLILTLVR